MRSIATAMRSRIAELHLGSSIIMIGQAKDDEYGRLVGNPDSRRTDAIYIAVADADAAHARAKKAGAVIVQPLRDTDHNSREFTCRDPEGKSVGVRYVTGPSSSPENVGPRIRTGASVTFDPIDRKALFGSLDGADWDSDGSEPWGGGALSRRGAARHADGYNALRTAAGGDRRAPSLSPRRGGDAGGAAGDHHPAHAGWRAGYRARRRCAVPARRAGGASDDQPEPGRPRGI